MHAKLRMRTFIILIAGLIGCWFSPALLAADESSSPEKNISATVSDDLGSSYVIGPGDILDISVWKEAALTKQVIVLPDGYITFPLIGAIKAEGTTVQDLEQVIADKLTRYIPHPNLSVAVHQVRSLYVYVIGKVNKSGRFELNANVTVLQALAMAGGLNPFAKKERIRIFRKENGETAMFAFDYSAVSRGRQLDQNITLKRGDIVVVP